MKNGLFTKSDLKFIHLLATRGVSFDDTYDLLLKERDLKRSKSSLVYILGIFAKVGETSRESIRDSKEKDQIHIKQLFCYYTGEALEVSDRVIGEFVKLTSSTVSKHRRRIENDIDVNYKPTVEFLDKIKNEMAHS